MLNLIARGDVRVLRNPSTHHGLETLATEILPAGNGARYPFLDPRLRDLLARCLAVDHARRPDLPEILRVARAAVETDTPATYAPDEARETDDVVAGVLRLLLYDADADVEGVGVAAPEPAPVPAPAPPPVPPDVEDRPPESGPFCVGIYEIPPTMNHVWSFP